MLQDNEVFQCQIVSALIICCMSTCLAVASIYITQPIFGDIAVTFNIRPDAARLAFGLASIAYAMAFFVMGPLTDYFSPVALGRTGLVLIAACLAGAAYMPTFFGFLTMMVLLGAAAAIVPAAMFALIPRIAPSGQIGSYFGMVIAASVVGITLGRSAMGILTGAVGWPNAFVISAVILVVMAMVTYFLPRDLGVSVKKPTNLRAAYGNAVAMLIDPELLRLFSMGFLLFFGYLGVVTFLTLHLQNAPFFYDSTTIGSISIVGLSAVLGAPISGWLASRFSPGNVAIVGLAIVAAAIVCLANADHKFSITAGLFFIFLGVFSCQPAIFVQIAQRARSDQRGTASSLYLLTCLGAGSFSSITLGSAWLNWGWSGITTLGLLAILMAGLMLVSDFYFRRQLVGVAVAPTSK